MPQSIYLVSIQLGWGEERNNSPLAVYTDGKLAEQFCQEWNEKFEQLEFPQELTIEGRTFEVDDYSELYITVLPVKG
jgi:hypothetical protein